MIWFGKVFLLWQLMCKAFSSQNVDKYQLSKIQFSLHERGELIKYMDIFHPFHLCIFKTKEEEQKKNNSTTFFEVEVTCWSRTQMGQLNCWQIPIVRNSTFAHRTKIVNALPFLFTGYYMVLRGHTGSIRDNFLKAVVVVSVLNIIWLEIVKKRNFLYILIQGHIEERHE